jgi:putative Mn2+ efflux pump MntP
MTLIEIFLTAVSLALDAAAVSIAASAMHHFKLKQALKVAGFFGFFQAAMPLLGWALGSSFKGMSAYDHLIAPALLLLVAGKMVWDIFQKEDEESERHISETKVLTMLSIATSIDAFVVGITFNFIKLDIPLGIAIIGLVTFALCLASLFVGKKGRHYFGQRVELLGAAVLVILAWKIYING